MESFNFVYSVLSNKDRTIHYSNCRTTIEADTKENAISQLKVKVEDGGYTVTYLGLEVSENYEKEMD